jgi:hypothetical protein
VLTQDFGDAIRLHSVSLCTTFELNMTNPIDLPCDGCGQIASSEHIGQRLQRLEWTTRYRPVHIHTLLLGAASPREEKDFLYSPSGDFHREAAMLLKAAGISGARKTREAVHAEFQRAGFFLTHILECAFETESRDGVKQLSLLEQRLSAVATRIRRSLKPKRVVLISQALEPIAEKIVAMQLGCPLVLDEGKPFALDGLDSEGAVTRLREALAIRTD